MDGRPTELPPNPYGAVTTPIVRSSTFTFPTSAEGAARFRGDEDGLIYGRLANPTVRALERALAELEGGEDAIATASGMGAIHVALMSVLRPGARLVVDHCVYGCTHSLLAKLATWGVRVTRTNLWDPSALRAALAEGADVVFLETPMNPTLRCVDIAQAARATHAAGGVLVVDNTFATPIGQRPLALGADLVVHSLTKALNGHSDLIAGAVVGPAARVAAAREWHKDAGPVMDPDAAWLVLRGMQTLELRVRQQCASALEVATRLDARGLRVHHPLLASHPDRAVAAAQMPLGVGVVSLDLGGQKEAMAFMDALRVFHRAVSLGGVESLVSHPASTTHATFSEEERLRAGIAPGLVRMSMGIERTELLLADVDRGLRALALPAGR